MGEARPAVEGVRRFGWPLRLLAAIVVAGVAEAVGTLIVGDKMTTWWPSLDHPAWALPVWAWMVVGLVYNAIMIAVLTIASGVAEVAVRRRLVGWSLAVVVANQLWALLFFGLESPLAALIGILPYAGLVAFLARQLWTSARVGAWILAPYVLWLVYDIAWLVGIVW